MPEYEFPNEAALLAADVVELDRQLRECQQQLKITRELLSAALTVANRATTALAQIESADR